MDAMKANAHEAERLLKQLANANRLLILCQLITGEKSVGELNDVIDLSQSALSQHLAKLRQERLIESTKHGQQVFYRVSNDHVKILLGGLYQIYCV